MVCALTGTAATLTSALAHGVLLYVRHAHLLTLNTSPHRTNVASHLELENAASCVLANMMRVLEHTPFGIFPHNGAHGEMRGSKSQ